MDNKFLYRSSLKNKNVPKFQIMGIASELILSKQVFPKNVDVSDFLKIVFNIEFKEYVMKSRTLILARIVRIINNSSDHEYQEFRKNLLNFVETYYESDLANKNSSKSSVSKWVTGE